MAWGEEALTIHLQCTNTQRNTVRVSIQLSILLEERLWNGTQRIIHTPTRDLITASIEHAGTHQLLVYWQRRPWALMVWEAEAPTMHLQHSNKQLDACAQTSDFT